MPDLSLFKPLCEILDITINELLSGEKINKDNYQEKLEENIINTINYSNEKLQEKNKFIGLIILVFGFLVIMLGLMTFNPDSHFCSFSIVIGVMFSIVGFYKLIKFKSYFYNLFFLGLFFIGYMTMILFFDYLGVLHSKRPPIFSTKITTINETIYYDTFFYDVVRCNKNALNETFQVIKNQEYNDEIIMNICN